MMSRKAGRWPRLPTIAGCSVTATLAVGALSLLTAILAVQTWRRFNPYADLATYLAATDALWNGSNPYATGMPAPFLYPLFICVVLWPLAQLPLGVAAVIWFCVSVLALAVALLLMLRIQGQPDVGRAIAASAIICVLLADPIQSNLRNGQINLVVLACSLAFGWYWSRGQGALASFWLAVAISLKITPGIFLIWLARRQEWRRIAATIGMVLGMTVVLPSLVAGPRIVDDYREYAQTFIGGRVAAVSEPIVDRRPYSFVGVLHRFTDVSWRFDAILIGLVVLLITGLVFDRGSAPGDHPSAAIVGLYLMAILLVTPMSEVHHLALVLPGLVWLTYQALGGELPRGQLAAAAFVVGAIMLRRYFHGAAFVGVAGGWLLLAIEGRRLRNRDWTSGRASG